MGAVGGPGLASVRSSDRRNDRQPEAGAASAARRVAAREALEGGEAVRDARTVVADVETDRTIARLGGQLDRRAAVAPGVVQQVAERLLEPQRVASHDEAVGAGRDRGLRRAAVAHSFEQLGGAQL